MPARDEEVTINNILFKVTNSDKRRLVQLKVTLPESEE
jgi:magnesium and cobalt transporter